MAPSHLVTVLEHSRVVPPPSAPKLSLPITFFDVMWVGFHPIHRLIFYDFPHSKAEFVDTIIPELKHALALTLQHFASLSGKLIVPSNSTTPEIRYVEGDSVLLIFAESNADFKILTGNQPRKAEDFYPLVPLLPEATESSESVATPVMALQVTSFPNVGICIGFTNHHGAGDANTMFNFIKSWASITKLGGESPNESLPFYDRSVVRDPDGLLKIFLSHLGKGVLSQTYGLPNNSDYVRATFILTRTDIQKLKNMVLTRRPKTPRVSSFTVVCAYVWSCIVKSRVAGGEEEEAGEEETEFFGFMADCRTRLDPPLPATYSGNCLAGCVCTAKTRHQVGGDGFLAAAEAIGEGISDRLDNEEGVLKGAKTWFIDYAKIRFDRIIGVSGSPKFNYYSVDFGWGKPSKFEFVSIDFTVSLSLNVGRESEGDMELGLCFSESRMNVFTAIFHDGLKVLEC